MLKITKEEIRCIWPSEDFVVIKVPRSRLTNIFFIISRGRPYLTERSNCVKRCVTWSPLYLVVVDLSREYKYGLLRCVHPLKWELCNQVEALLNRIPSGRNLTE